MEKTELIKRPIAQEMLTFREVFDASLNTSNPLLSEILGYIRRRSGKMMRPMLTLLVAKSFGPLSPAAYHAAATLEMLHTASLVHDDVVDESDERRGQPSVNSAYDNKVSVLVGDYLLSTSLHHAALTGDAEIVRVVARLGQDLSEGEILQLSNISSSSLSEDTYYEIIRKKTAVLFATCAQLGAMASGASAADTERFRLFGEKVGICFQIKDDIFDYYESPELGKPTGNDMLEGKLTLPAIYTVNTSADDHIRDLVKRVKSGHVTHDEIVELIRFTKAHGGIEYAMQAMEKLRREALDLILPVQDDDIRTALEAFLSYVVERTK